MIRSLAAVALLTLVYALALASFDPWDLAFGVALSSILLYVSRPFVFGEGRTGGPGLLRRVLVFFPFATVIVWEILKGTLEVALITLHLRPLGTSGIVEVPFGDRTPMGLAVWAIITGLPPGSFFVDLDQERRVAYIHLLDARDPDAFRRQQADFYRRFQRHVFP